MPIYQRGSSYLVSVGSKDTRYRASFSSLNEAQVAELEALARMKASGSPLEPSRSAQNPKARGRVLKDAHDLAWAIRWSQHKKGGQETHRVFCRAIFREIPEGTPLKDITFQTILDAVEAWEEAGNGSSSVNNKMGHLSIMLKTALDQGWIDSLPRMIRRKSKKGRIRWMDAQEELKVLTMCHALGLDELADFIVMGVDTGFRRGELLGLSPRDYFNGQLHLHAGETKNEKPRAVPVTSRVAEILKRRANRQRVFDLTIGALRSQWWKLKVALGYQDDDQFVPHMLRHTCASRMVQAGVDLPIVMEWLGHSDISVTMVYAHLRPDSLNKGRDALEQVTPMVVQLAPEPELV